MRSANARDWSERQSRVHNSRAVCTIVGPCTQQQARVHKRGGHRLWKCILRERQREAGNRGSREARGSVTVITVSRVGSTEVRAERERRHPSLESILSAAATLAFGGCGLPVVSQCGVRRVRFMRVSLIILILKYTGFQYSVSNITVSLSVTLLCHYTIVSVILV